MHCTEPVTKLHISPGITYEFIPCYNVLFWKSYFCFLQRRLLAATIQLSLKMHHHQSVTASLMRANSSDSNTYYKARRFYVEMVTVAAVCWDLKHARVAMFSVLNENRFKAFRALVRNWNICKLITSNQIINIIISKKKREKRSSGSNDWYGWPGSVTQQLSCDPWHQCGTRRCSSVCLLKIINRTGTSNVFKG